MTTACSFTKGSRIHVFHSSQSDTRQHLRHDVTRWFRTATVIHGLNTPRQGYTHSWQPAVVAADFDGAGYQALDKSTWIQCHLSVESSEPLRTGGWFNRNGKRLECDGASATTVLQVPPDRVSLDPPPPPHVSFMVVRWGGVPQEYDADSWGPTGATSSDAFIDAFFE